MLPGCYKVTWCTMGSGEVWEMDVQEVLLGWYMVTWCRQEVVRCGRWSFERCYQVGVWSCGAWRGSGEVWDVEV